MDIVARELRSQQHLLVYSASWFSLPLPDAVAGQFSAEEHRFGIHAGDIETSMMLHPAPSAVQMEHARDFLPTPQDRAARYAILGNGSAKFGWPNAGLPPCRSGRQTRRRPLPTRGALWWRQRRSVLLQELHDLPLSALVDAVDLAG